MTVGWIALRMTNGAYGGESPEVHYGILLTI